ncbi:MAG TPA: helix-turn-helix domain-containing protein [Polyangiaceae bacterium]|nr:helix-turn-helix domain-containing protein [Polyangiaceae bacterium]
MGRPSKRSEEDGSERGSDGARDLTAGDLARLLEVDLKTIHNWVNQGHVFARRTEGRHLRFQRVEVVRFLRRFGYPVPGELGKTPPRVLVHNEGARKKIPGVEQHDGAGLFATVLEVASGFYEVLVLSLDAHEVAVVRELVLALRARPATRGVSVVGLSRKPARRSAFVDHGGDVALAPGKSGSVAQAARWLTGGAERPPRGALISWA